MATTTKSLNTTTEAPGSGGHTGGAWDESKHPRSPAGTSLGGKFTSSHEHAAEGHALAEAAHVKAGQAHLEAFKLSKHSELATGNIVARSYQSGLDAEKASREAKHASFRAEGRSMEAGVQTPSPHTGREHMITAQEGHREAAIHHFKAAEHHKMMGGGHTLAHKTATEHHGPASAEHWITVGRTIDDLMHKHGADWVKELARQSKSGELQKLMESHRDAVKSRPSRGGYYEGY